MSKAPIPIPTGRDLFRWAMQLVDYLRSLETELDTPGPKILQLEHKRPDAKATQDGILMYDPATGDVVVSKAGQWKKLALVP